MDITFRCDGQTLIRTDSRAVASGSSGFVTAGFTLDAEWSALTVSAVFSRAGESYQVVLDGDRRAPVATEVLTEPGWFEVGIVGVGEGGELRATANTVSVEVEDAGALSGVNSVGITPTLADQLTAKINSILVMSGSTDLHSSGVVPAFDFDRIEELVRGTLLTRYFLWLGEDTVYPAAGGNISLSRSDIYSVCAAEEGYAVEYAGTVRGEDGKTPIFTAERDAGGAVIKADGEPLVRLCDGAPGRTPEITAFTNPSTGAKYIRVDGVSMLTLYDGEDGSSAYEIACRNGFSGSEEQWLASLKGERGETGGAVVAPPVIVSSEAEMTDPAKLYALNGEIYQYETREVGAVDLLTLEGAETRLNRRYDFNNHQFKSGSECAVIIPLELSAGGSTALYLKGAVPSSVSTNYYGSAESTGDASFIYNVGSKSANTYDETESAYVLTFTAPQNSALSRVLFVVETPSDMSAMTVSYAPSQSGSGTQTRHFATGLIYAVTREYIDAYLEQRGGGQNE